MKTLLIYTPTWYAFGGGEKYLILLAEVLSGLKDTSVVMLSENHEIQKSALEKFSDVDLSNVQYKLVHNSRELDTLAGDADVFINLSTFRAVKTSARKIVQVLQIPYGKIGPATILKKMLHGELKEAGKDIYRLQLHSFARKQASLVLVYSEFVRDVLLRNFGINGTVLYPPIQDYSRPGISKKNIILSVGRIFRGLYNDKRYDILTEAFRRASHKELSGWEYHIAGSAAQDPATSEYLESLRNENKNYPVYFHVNEPYESLVRLYNEASVFWHAAGYNVDEETNPENTEHFGMTTIESMSAKCIPVVINKGGQRESVSHGVDGFLWSSIDELIARTSDIINVRCDLEDIRRNARKRYEDFDLDHFQRNVVELFSPLFK
jgi:glycosyltransferase involved in cell wall biosynthesis